MATQPIAEKTKLAELLEILDIKRATIYPWLAHTGIKSCRDQGENEVYFLPEQVQELLDFKAYLGEGGKMRHWRSHREVIAKAQSAELATIPEPEPEIDREAVKISQLVTNAQKQAAGILIAQNLLAAQFIDNPDTLPKEMRDAISETKPLPKSIDPLQYAKDLIKSRQETLVDTEAIQAA